MFRTNTQKSRTSARIVFIFLFWSYNALCVEPSWVGKTKFNGNSSGVVRAIIVHNNHLYLGAENGFLDLVGETSSFYSPDNSVLSDGYISDLSLDSEGNIWLTQYGSGVFIFKPGKRSLSKYSLPPDIENSSWALAIEGAYLGISLINQILILNTETGERLIIDKNHDKRSLRRIYGAEYLNSFGFVFPEADGLVAHDPHSGETRFYPKDKYFPKLDAVTSVSVHNNSLLVGGPGGIYIWDTSEVGHYYPFEDTRAKANDIDQIFVDSQGRIWIAAIGLYYLDTSKNVITELKREQPKYSTEQIKTISAIAELESGEVIVASSQLGVLTINSIDTGIKYLHEKDFPYRKDLHSVISVNRNEALIKTSDQWFLLNSNTGKMTGLGKTSFETEPILIPNGLFFSAQHCALFELNDGSFYMVTTVQDPKSYCEHIKPLSYERNGNFYIYYEAESYAGFVQLIDGELRHYVNTPKDIRFISTENSKYMIVLDRKNSLFSMEEQGVWIKHEAVNMKKFFIYCMYASPSVDEIFLCTSGGGLKQYDMSARRFENAFEELDLPRFIRDGFIDDQGHHWLATNKGLVLVTPGFSYQFDSSDGVIDSDFNYQGLISLRNMKFTLGGDQMSYLIDTQKLTNYVQSRRNYTSVAEVVSLQLVDGKKKANHYSREFFNKTLDVAPEEIIFEFASADYVYSHLHKLEYRLMGFHEDWQELPSNMGTVAYSGLSFGNFDFEVRVVDSKSDRLQPISRYSFNIARPFWYTWQAYLLYLAAISLCIWLAIILIKRHMVKRSRVLAGIIEQKQSALMESNRSIRELLNKKEKIFSNLANEIKTPLMQMLNPLADLRAQLLTADIRSKVDMVYDNAGRLRVLTDQLSAVERIDHISEQIPQRYDIKNTLDFLIDTLRPAALEKQLILSCDCDIKEPVLLVRDSLEALINPILFNAICYTQTGGQVRIKACIQADQIVLCINDNGPGIAKEQLEFIISRFNKGSNYNGSAETGIGLNLANSLAFANDGWLEINSEPNKGTEVSVYLAFNPALAAEGIETNPSREVPAKIVAEQSAQYRHNNLPVVLVIERSQASCEYIINLLGDRFNCYSVQRGMQALEIIPILQPDIVLTELNIPDISGAVFTEKLRELKSSANVPVMILTATSDYSSKLDCFKASVNDYLVKPVEQDELISRIESNLTYSRLAHRHNTIRSADEDADDTCAYVKTILPKCSNEKERKFIVKFLDVIEKNYQDENFNRSRAADLMAVSERQLNRILSKLMPDNFTTFLKKYRLEKSMPMLEQGLQITQIAVEVGFGSGAYYSRCFRQVHGLLPSEYEFPQR